MANVTRALLWAALLVAVFVGDAASAADDELLSAVVVSRHGVRSPTATQPPLATIAADPWPSWSVPPGYLTQRGAELARLLGGYYRESYVAQGLLPAQGCPPGDVFAWADVDQRTRATAEALLKGMFPDCGLTPGHRTDAKIDPLFHPTRAGTCRIDPAQAREAVLDRVGGNFTIITAAHRSELAAMQSVLKCCAPAVCRASGATAPCTLGELSNAIAGSHDRVRLAGPIAIGSTASEVFLLEYAQGLPENQVAWGRASTPQAMRPLWRLHTLQFDLMQRTPYLAARQGSALVQRILATMPWRLNGRADVQPASRSQVDPAGGARRRSRQHRRHARHPLVAAIPIRTRRRPPARYISNCCAVDKPASMACESVFISQTPEQMRQTAPLDRAHPPEQAIASIEGCATSAGGTCPWTAFEALAEESHRSGLRGKGIKE